MYDSLKYRVKPIFIFLKNTEQTKLHKNSSNWRYLHTKNMYKFLKY